MEKVENRSDRLLKNTALLSFGNICTKGVMFIMTPLFTRWLTQSDYGTFDLLVTYLSLITPVITIDIKEAVFRFLIGDEFSGQKEAIITTGLLAHLVSVVLCMIVSLILAAVMHEYRYIVIFYAMMIVSETLYSFWTVLARGLRKPGVFAAGNIVYVAAMALASLLFVRVLDGGLLGLLASYATGYLVSCLYMGVTCKTHLYVDLRQASIKIYAALCKYALPMLPNSVAWWVMNVSDRTIVSLYLGVEANAILAVTSKLPNLCQELFGKFHLSWQETAVDSIAAQDRDAFYSKIMNELLRFMASLSVMILGLDYIYFRYLFSVEYYSGYYLTPVLILAILIYMLTQFLGGIYIAQMRPKRNGATTTIAALINLAIDLLLVRKIGLWAAVLSTFTAYLVLFIIRYTDIRKSIDLRFEQKTFSYVLAVIYFAGACYINSAVLNYINACLGCTFFVAVNWRYGMKIIRRFFCKES